MPMWEPLCKPASRRLRVRECAASRHCTACVLPATTASADAASRAGCEVSGACIRMLSAREAIAACWLCTSAAHASAWPALPRRVVWRHCAACKGCCKALGHVHKHQFSAAEHAGATAVGLRLPCTTANIKSEQFGSTLHAAGCAHALLL